MIGSVLAAVGIGLARVLAAFGRGLAIALSKAWDAVERLASRWVR